MQYLLDTNICIFFLRGKLKLDEIIREKGISNCFISELTVFELKFGAENSANPKQSHKAVDRFVGGLSIIPIIGSVDKYAEIKVKLIVRGIVAIKVNKDPIISLLNQPKVAQSFR